MTKEEFKSYVFEKEAAKISDITKEKLETEEFALPGRRYPIHDLAHARNALARVAQFGTPSEREIVRKKVFAKFPELKEGFVARHGVSPTAKKVIKKPRLGQVYGKESEAVSPRYRKAHRRAIAEAGGAEKTAAFKEVVKKIWG